VSVFWILFVASNSNDATARRAIASWLLICCSFSLDPS